MLLRCGYDMTFSVAVPTPMLAMISPHPARHGDLHMPHRLTLSPDVATHTYRDAFGNVVTRAVLPPGETTLSTDFLVRDDGRPDAVAPDASEVPIAALPADAIVFLLGSRYCETDRMMDLAWRLFGSIPAGWGRVQAIVDYTHDRLRFDYQQARATRTAFEAHEERVGVCRDFAHLAITLCRCMNIPARYCTGWLGDIRIEPLDDPMDFSAWIEVFLDGQWFTFDARHNVPRVGRVLMARGRDATDVAITTLFGFNRLIRFDVIAEEVTE